ncbi:hypothetical protein T484DRAFT_1936022 [Baffinella frigidus]|nr:hypothetical protein T484DRAFT_1936022 [Cryptophyta sp. CCMP2293]
MPKFEPSFYYDGVTNGEWHDGWQDFRSDFDSGKDGSSWRVQNQDPQSHSETTGPFGTEGWSRARSDLQAPYQTDHAPTFDKDHPDWGRIRAGFGPGRPEGQFPGQTSTEGFSEQDSKDFALSTAGDRGEVPRVDSNPRVNFLYPNGFLSSEQYELSFIKSAKYSEYALVCHQDGDLTLYHMGMPEVGSSSRTGGYAVWSSNSRNRKPGPFRCVMQTDGNLVVLSQGEESVWSSGTAGQGADGGQFNKLTLHQDGLLEITDKWGVRVWSARP